MEVSIVGEDQVTQAIIIRLIKDYRTDINVKNILPVRGGQIKKFAPNYNKLDEPIILLTDLDNYDCAPSLIRDWIIEPLSKKFLFRVACDEAESWLMADRQGFAKWLSVSEEYVPTSKVIDRRKNINEMDFPYKPSLYMMQNIIPHSTNDILKDGLQPRDGASKGSGYNTALLPFINKTWNVEGALKNSYSLKVTIERIKQFGITST